jgi:hypothetical protein
VLAITLGAPPCISGALTVRAVAVELLREHMTFTLQALGGSARPTPAPTITW